MMKQKIKANVAHQRPNIETQLRRVKRTYSPFIFLDDLSKTKSDELLKTLYQGIRINNKAQWEINLQTLLANLITHEKRFFSISLNNNYWVKNQYRKTTANTIELIYKLSNEGYIEMYKGKGNENVALAYDTKIRATDRLLNQIKIFPEEVIYQPPLIEVRDDNKKLLPYKETIKTRRIKKILTLANEVNGQAEIKHKNIKLSTSLTCIFTNKPIYHGRLYTRGFHHYQGLSGTLRAEIKINGESVTELDFSGLHPNLLYAKEGFQFFGDPYKMVIPDSSPQCRDFLKEALLSLINSQGALTPKKPKEGQKQHWRTARFNAGAGINQRLNKPDNHEVKETLEGYGITTGEDLIKGFESAHPKISHYFCSDESTGKKLMNLDSDICLNVVNHFIKQGKPILSVHDSFIVQSRYRDELKKVMKTEYQKKAGGKRIKIH